MTKPEIMAQVFATKTELTECAAKLRKLALQLVEDANSNLDTMAIELTADLAEPPDVAEDLELYLSWKDKLTKSIDDLVAAVSEAAPGK